MCPGLVFWAFSSIWWWLRLCTASTSVDKKLEWRQSFEASTHSSYKEIWGWKGNLECVILPSVLSSDGCEASFFMVQVVTELEPNESKVHTGNDNFYQDIGDDQYNEGMRYEKSENKDWNENVMFFNCTFGQ